MSVCLLRTKARPRTEISSFFTVKQFVEGEAEREVFFGHLRLDVFNASEALGTVHMVKRESLVDSDSVDIVARLNATGDSELAMPAQFVVFKDGDEVNLCSLSEGSDVVDSCVHVGSREGSPLSIVRYLKGVPDNP